MKRSHGKHTSKKGFRFMILLHCTDWGPSWSRGRSCKPMQFYEAPLPRRLGRGSVPCSNCLTAVFVCFFFCWYLQDLVTKQREHYIEVEREI